MTKSEEKMVFAIGQTAGGEPMLILGVSEAAWTHMKDGKTHHFDFAKVGLPLKLMVFGQATRAECLKAIEAHNQRAGVATLYEPGKDYGIDALQHKE